MHKEVNPEIQIPNPDLGSPPSSGDQQKVDCPTSPRPLALLPYCLLEFWFLWVRLAIRVVGDPRDPRGWGLEPR